MSLGRGTNPEAPSRESQVPLPYPQPRRSLPPSPPPLTPVWLGGLFKIKSKCTNKESQTDPVGFWGVWGWLEAGSLRGSEQEGGPSVRKEPRLPVRRAGWEAPGTGGRASRVRRQHETASRGALWTDSRARPAPLGWRSRDPSPGPPRASPPTPAPRQRARPDKGQERERDIVCRWGPISVHQGGRSAVRKDQDPGRQATHQSIIHALLTSLNFKTHATHEPAARSAAAGPAP